MHLFNISQTIEGRRNNKQILSFFVICKIMYTKKVIALLLILAFILPQIFIFFAGAEEDYTIDLSSSYDEWLEERSKYDDKSISTPEVGEEIKSKDGKYGYVLNKKTKEAYFSHSFEKNITVLNIPEEIDGHRIVGTIYGISESSNLIEINYSKYIKDIFVGGLDFADIPSCRINLNEGLEVIHLRAFLGIADEKTGREEYLDELIFPTTLKEIKPFALDTNIKRIVFQSDPIVDLVCDDIETIAGAYGEFEWYDKREIYYTGDALNATDRSFCETWGYFETPTTLAHPWKIYHKPGAKGFEKFKEVGHEVYEYTEEVWGKTQTINPDKAVTTSTTKPLPNGVITIIAVLAVATLTIVGITVYIIKKKKAA